MDAYDTKGNIITNGILKFVFHLSVHNYKYKGMQFCWITCSEIRRKEENLKAKSTDFLSHCYWRALVQLRPRRGKPLHALLAVLRITFLTQGGKQNEAN
jgi:hypothetical protein